MKPHDALLDYFLHGKIAQGISEFYYSATRGEAALRLSPLLNATLRFGFNSNEASLIVSSVGEILNNSFDHNLGYWNEKTGCCLSWTFESQLLTLGIADLGRGIVESLKPVLSANTNSQNIMQIAFEQVITGRAPEHRGNGLKYVRAAICKNVENSLICFSNNFSYQVGMPQPPALSKLPVQRSTGTLTFLQWRLT